MTKRKYDRPLTRDIAGPITQFLVAAHVRRLEKQDTCKHGDVAPIMEQTPEPLYECVCGKVFNEDELDELEWALED